MIPIPVTAIMIAYENEDKSLERLHRDLLPALHDPRLNAELIVIDNSATKSERLAAAVNAAAGLYYWSGTNLMYGLGLNMAVELARHPYLLYVCTNHGHARDHSWALDLLAPLVADRTVAMTGSLADSGPPENAGFSPSLPRVHVQGGVFAARRDVLRTYRYPDGQYKHWGADIVMSFQLMAAGFRLVDVPTVKSVWRTTLDGHWKYLHAE